MSDIRWIVNENYELKYDIYGDTVNLDKEMDLQKLMLMS